MKYSLSAGVLALLLSSCSKFDRACYLCTHTTTTRYGNGTEYSTAPATETLCEKNEADIAAYKKSHNGTATGTSGGDTLRLIFKADCVKQ